MPTGLTSKIYEGEDTSLRGFALQCVRQLGYGYYASNYGEKALPLDKAPDIKPSNYHKKELEKAKKQLEDFIELQKKPDELHKKYEEYLSTLHKNDEKSKKSKEQVKERYLSVLGKVEKWDAPSEFNSLVELMKDQLNDCIKYDCTTHDYDNDKKEQSIEEWAESEISSIKWSIEYHKKEYEVEVKHAKECNEYIHKLYEELDKIDPLK